MSSHHFVRQQQSPAVLIMGQDIRRDILDQLLEWNPTVMATSDVVDMCSMLNIKIDVLLTGDGNSVGELPYLPERWPVDSFGTYLKRLKDQGIASGIVVAGPKISEEDLLFNMLKGEWQEIIVYSGDCKYYLIAPRKEHHKWMQEGSRFRYWPSLQVDIEGEAKLENGFVVVEADGMITLTPRNKIIFIEYL